ncbi:MAG: hypothetical protein KAQ90_03580, partial [Melioribacteraceae bacterium]|nr:hypothetical protein [Melioribacteraceae bacterium]
MKIKDINFIVFIFLFNLSVTGQEVDEESFSIEWISNFSREVDVKSEEGFFSNLLNLFTGVSEKKLLKPFNLVKLDEDSYIILDQDLFAPILVSLDGFEIIQSNEYKIFPSLVGICRYT